MEEKEPKEEVKEEEKDEEIKIFYKNIKSFSSFFINNLSQVIESKVCVQYQEEKDVHPGFNIEVQNPKIEPFYGELTAANAICHNAKHGKVGFLKESLFIDHWIFYLTGEFKQLAEKMYFTKDKKMKDVTNAIKAACKEIEHQFIPELDLAHKGPLETLAYCYLSPIKKLLNGKMQSYVKKLGEALECDPPETFFKKSSGSEPNYSILL
jgi:hypothetical protein